MTTVLNPASETVTLYVPASRAGTENVPVVFVTVSKVVPVARFFTTTAAPGMTPPLGSTTTPEMDDVAPPCAYANVVTNSTARLSRLTLSFMRGFLPRCCTPLPNGGSGGCKFWRSRSARSRTMTVNGSGCQWRVTDEMTAMTERRVVMTIVSARRAKRDPRVWMEDRRTWISEFRIRETGYLDVKSAFFNARGAPPPLALPRAFALGCSRRRC